MGQNICLVSGCVRVARRRELCQRHDRNLRAFGSPHRPCQHCGSPIEEPNKRFCSPTCRPPCTVEGCGQPRRKNGWCAAHYSQWARKGEVAPFGYKWGEAGQGCVVCGSDIQWGSGRRKYCSKSCQSVNSNHGGSRPSSSTCIACAEPIVLVRDAGGRLKRTDQVWCDSCVLKTSDIARWRRYGVTPQQYQKALVAGCDLCGRHVRRLDIDHDHSCCDENSRITCGNCVRGFLCNPCNRGLGVFQDDLELIRRAVKYLESPPMHQ